MNKKIDPAEEWLGRQWLGRLFDLLAPENVTPEIKKRLFEYVYELLEKTNQKDPPFQPYLIGPYRRVIKSMETTLDGTREGILNPTLGGFILKIEKNLHPFRKRLTFAHELGHSFFYNLEEDIPTIGFQKSASRFWVREGYASEIARAILMPARSIISFLKEKRLSPSIASLKKLSGLFRVSYDALRLRLVNDLKIWDCVIFRSQVGTVNGVKTKRFDVSKGISYQKLHIPMLLKKDNLFYDELYLAIHSAFDKGNETDEIYIRNNKYLFQSMVLKDRSHSDTCISIILQK